MMVKNRTVRVSVLATLFFVCASFGSLYAQPASDGAVTAGPVATVAAAAAAASSQSALVQGYNSFKSGDWTSATIFLRKAVTQPANSTQEAWYMLIMSQMYSEDYKGAVTDCNTFITSFPEGSLKPFVQYQKGRALHYLGQNDDSVLVLSDFCHLYPSNEMYPSALFWIAECFYDDYNFDTARTMYERIVADFPDDAKAKDAEYKLDTIAQHEREQKLLYLLKMTSEEYLSTSENYEKLFKQYQTEDTLDLRKQLKAANARIAELEAAASETLAAAKKASKTTSSTEDPDVVALKAKALQLQKLLDAQNSTK